MTLEVMSPTEALLDGRYILKEPVGKGGMATVYRAEDSHLGRTVAIKMIHHDDAMDSADRAHTEKTVLASLSHPSLVTLFDAQLDPGRPQYLVMEFVDGPTLGARMAVGPIPGPQLARITRDLAQGLAAVHAAGIAHRDVKPSNVLMTHVGDRDGERWVAKLADFGIACELGGSRMTTPGIVLGTLSYMAPEQLRDTDPGTAADIFSLGLVVLEALTGEQGYPGLGSGRSAAIARLMNAPTIPETVDDEWRALLERMTRLEPSERPTAQEVAQAARDLERSGAVAVGAASVGAAAAVPAPVAAAAVAQPRSRAGSRPTVAEEMAESPSSASRTRATAVIPPVRAWQRSRRAVLGALGVVAVAGLMFAGSTLMASPEADGARFVSQTTVRTAAPVENVAETPVVTEPVVSEPVAPVTPVTPVETVETVDTVDTVTDDGNQGNGNGNGNPGNGNGNPGNGNPGNGNGNKPDNAGKPDKSK